VECEGQQRTVGGYPRARGGGGTRQDVRRASNLESGVRGGALFCARVVRNPPHFSHFRGRDAVPFSGGGGGPAHSGGGQAVYFRRLGWSIVSVAQCSLLCPVIQTSGSGKLGRYRSGERRQAWQGGMWVVDRREQLVDVGAADACQ